MMRHAGKPPGPHDRVLKLPDGRLLGYAEFGDPAGGMLFFFHGCRGSRFSGAFLDAAAKERGVRVVALERPGFGLSDFQLGRSIAAWFPLPPLQSLTTDRAGTSGSASLTTGRHSSPESMCRAGPRFAS